jgi:hypothetical protein
MTDVSFRGANRELLYLMTKADWVYETLGLGKPQMTMSRVIIMFSENLVCVNFLTGCLMLEVRGQKGRNGFIVLKAWQQSYSVWHCRVSSHALHYGWDCSMGVEEGRWKTFCENSGRAAECKKTVTKTTFIVGLSRQVMTNSLIILFHIWHPFCCHSISAAVQMPDILTLQRLI